MNKTGSAVVLGAALALVVAGAAEAGAGSRGGGHGGSRGSHAHSGSHSHSHSHGRYYGGRVVIGARYYYPYWPYYYYPAPAYVAPAYYAPAAAPVYVEQSQFLEETGAPAPGSAWYYCPSARQYYPQVQACPEGWTQVPASPPAR